MASIANCNKLPEGTKRKHDEFDSYALENHWWLDIMGH